jgi:hypothetical protein
MRRLPAKEGLGRALVCLLQDIIIDNFRFEMPLSRYEGKDFVIWGREDKIREGDVLNGVNSGVFAMRNTDWSRDFLEKMVPFGSFPANETYDEVHPLPPPPLPIPPTP